MLAAVQKALVRPGIQFRSEHTTETDSYAEFKQIMDGRRLRHFTVVRLRGV